MDTIELTKLVESFEKLKEHRDQMYAEYFQAQHEISRLIAKAGSGSAALSQADENAFFQWQQRLNTLDAITDVIDHIWYGIFNQTPPNVSVKRGIR